jgi:galactose oxidase-like protein
MPVRRGEPGPGVGHWSAPSSGNIAPPGYYMVFIVNGTDVPSVAKIVKI